MMEFILMTLSFTVAIILAGVICTVAVFAAMKSPKVIGWYMNYVQKITGTIVDNFEFVEEEKL